MNRQAWRRLAGPAAYLTCFVFGVSAWVTYVHTSGDSGLKRFVFPFVAGVDLNFNNHLGGEYLNIATALAEGRGFSDPFALGTGATAWMPPVYSCLLALLILALPDLDAVTLAILLLKNLTLVAVGLVLYSAEPGGAAPRWIRLIVYTLWLLVFCRWFFLLTHDCWLVTVLVTLQYLAACSLWRREVTPRRAVGWGVLGGLIALAQPVLAFVWMLLTGLAYRRLGSRLLLLALVPCILIPSMWVLRNYVVFDKPVLFKSNLFFDFHQANVLPGNGVLSEPSFEMHPVNQGPDDAYARLGEAAFVESFRAPALRKLTENTGDYVVRVRNRLLAATLIYVPYFRWFEGRFRHLVELIYPLPFFAIVILLVFSRLRLSVEMLVAIVTYAGFLLPYILITFYIRYAIPLVLLQMLFVAWAIELVTRHLRSVAPAVAEE